MKTGFDYIRFNPIWTHFFSASAFFHWLGYVAVAALLFGLMYVMGCAPVMGESKDSLMACRLWEEWVMECRLLHPAGQ